MKPNFAPVTSGPAAASAPYGKTIFAAAKVATVAEADFKTNRRDIDVIKQILLFQRKVSARNLALQHACQF
jgi:hypothetical protein